MSERSEELAQRLIAHKTGELASLMLHLGLRLGLFEAMRGRSAVSVDALARTSGLHRRWVLEWLRQQTASGVIEYVDEERFRLTDEMAELLLDDAYTGYLGWLFGAPVVGAGLDRLVEAFRTGLGMSWDDHGEAGAHMVATSTSAQHRLLATAVLPLMENVVERLARGAEALDVGCGSGVAITELARAFPRSTFVGIDPSATALDRARMLVREAGLDNVELRLGSAEELADPGRFDFAMVLDCMHDMTHPQQAMAAVRRALKDDGAWLVKDIRCQDTLKQNLEHPMGAMLYGVSIAFCMSSSMSKPDGAGLGTLGFSAARAREMAQAAGFRRFRVLDYEDDPLNSFYELRP
jgi:2-polyprenyl-3-methyl-5-hydroxy-6-metoxy-1,4-benzoquinol methylase